MTQPAPTPSDIPDPLAEALEAARRAPEDASTWDALDDIVRELDRPEEAAALYREVCGRELSDELRDELGKRAVDFHEEWFEEPSLAISLLKQLVGLAGADWAFERLSLMLTMAERWDELLGEYDRALARVVDLEPRLQLLDEAARIAKDFAGQSGRASDYLKELLYSTPDNEQLAISLQRRLEQQERHQDLVDIWNARLTVLHGAEALAVRVQIAEKELEKLRDAQAALVVAEEILQIGGGDDEAIAVLERIAASQHGELEARRRALQILQQRYGAAGQGAEVIRVLELSLTIARDDAQRKELHAACANSLIESGRKHEAMQHAAALFTLEPNSTEVHEQLHQLAEATDGADRYAEALVDAAAACQSADRRVELLVEAGQIYETRVRDESAAIELYASVLSDGAAGDAPRLLVARRLRALLSSAEEPGRLLDVLEKLAALEPSPSGQREALAEAAKLADMLGSVDRALDLWQRCLEASAGDTAALDARVDLLERSERWEQLITDLRRRSEAVTGLAQRRGDLVRVARIYETKLFRLEQAIEVWRQIEETFGKNSQTVDALVDLSSAARRYEDVIELLSDAIELEANTERRTAQLARLGDVYREHQGDPSRAVRYYREALEADCLHEGSRTGLRALLGEEDCAREAVETLAAALREADEWPGVLELVEQRVRASTDPSATYEILRQAASLMEQRAQDPGGALPYLCRAFELDPGEELEGEIQRVARTSGHWHVAVSGYQRAIEQCESEERVRTLRFVLGEILESRLSDRAAALASYREILHSLPTHREASQAAARVAAQLGAYDDVAWVLVNHAQASGALDPEVAASVAEAAQQNGAWDSITRALYQQLESEPTFAAQVGHDLHRQLGLWFRDERRDNRVAERLLLRATEEVRDPSTLTLLADLQRAEPGKPLVATLLTLAEHAEEPLPVLYEAARVALETVGDPSLAQPILEQARKVAADAMRTLELEGPERVRGTLAEEVADWCNDELVRLAQRQEDYSRALDLLVSASALPFAEDRQIALSFRAAGVAMHNLQNANRAVEICLDILQRAPAHAETIELLGDIYEKGERHLELLELRQSELKHSPPLERRLTLRLDAARLLPLVGYGDEERIEALDLNISESPGHTESIEQLSAILSAMGAYQRLYDLLATQAAAVAEAGDGAQAAELWARAGQLSELQIDDPAQATSAYEASVKLAPRAAVLDALSRLCTAAGDHEAAVSWLEQRLALTPEDDIGARRDTLVRLATELRTCDRTKEAREHLKAGLERDPGGEAMRELLAEIYRKERNWSALAPLLTTGVGYTIDRKKKVEYLRDAARVRRRELKQLDEAIPLLQEAVDLEPEDRPLRLSLADGLRHARRHDEARNLLETLLGEFGRRRTPERARVHYHLAQIARATGNLDVALEQLDLASKVDRNNMQMLKLLGDVAREKGQLEEAERAYRTLLLLLGRRRPEQVQAYDAVGESSVLFELHRIAIDLGQADRAKDLLDSALEAAAHDVDEARRLEEALREAGQHELLLRALDQRLQNTKEPEHCAEILRTRADVLLELQRPEEALDARLAALDNAPSTPDLAQEVWDHATQLGRTESVAKRIAEMADRARDDDPPLACALWVRLAKLCEAQEDRANAFDLYRRALATGVQPVECLDGLERVGLTSRPEEVAPALSLFVQFADPDATGQRFTDALVKLGTIDLAQGRRQHGAQHLEHALDRGFSGAQCLEILLGSLESHPPDPEVVALIERVSRDVGNRRGLLLALTRGARLGIVPLDRLKEGAELARAEGDDAALHTLLQGAVEVGRNSSSIDDAMWAVTQLTDLYEAEGKPNEAVSLLQDSIASAGIAEAFELRLRLAALATDPLQDFPLAASVYEALLEETPTAVRVWRPLFDVYRRMGAQGKLEERIAAIESAVDNPELRQSLRIERVRILLDAHRTEEAEGALREFLAENPDSEEASELLEDLLERQGRLDEMRVVVEQRLAAARERGDIESITRRTLRFGKVLAQADENAARDVYRTSLELSPDNQPVLEAFLQLLQGPEHAEERAATLERVISAQSGDKAESNALALLALRQEAGDEEGMQKALRLGLSRAPGSQALHERRVRWYRERENWSGLAIALCAQGAAFEEPGRGREKILEAAEIYRTQLQDARLAAETLETALNPTKPNPDLLETIAQCWVDAGELERAISHLTQAIEAHQERDTSLAVLLRQRGQLYMNLQPETLGSLSAAADDFAESAQIEPEGARAELAQALYRKLERLGTEGVPEVEHGPTILRLARALQDLQRLDEAVDQLRSWIAAHPEDKAAQQQVGELATQQKDWETAAEAYRNLIPLCSGEELNAAALSLAEACDKLGDPMAARDVLERVYAEQPGDPTLRARLRQMYEAAGEHRGWASMLMTEAETVADSGERFNILCTAGNLFLQADDSLELAFQAFEKALEIKPDADVLVRSVDAQVRLGQIEEAATRLDEAIRTHGKRRSPELSVLQHAMARVADAAGDEDAIFAWLEAALYSDRQNGTVAAELASLAMSRGEFDVAIKALQLVTLLKTPGPMSRAEAYLRQAVIARHRDDPKKSILLAKRAITTDPDYEDAKQFLEDLQAEV